MQARTLLLIDLQVGFDYPAWGARLNPALEDNVAKLLTQWRCHRWPAVHVHHDSLLPQSPLRPGQPGRAFVPSASPLPGEPVIAKTVNSAFIETDLDARLRNLNMSRLTLVGLTSDHCVSTTARMGANLGFDVEVVADATATFPRRRPLGHGDILPAELVHDTPLASLAGEFARIVPTAAYLEPIDFRRD